MKLAADLLRQWIATITMRERMHRELPHDFKANWQTLPWKRYQIFYGVLVPVIIHDTLFRMHNASNQYIPRKVMTAQGLVTGLFDDLTDRLHLPGERIQHLIETPDYIISSDFIEEHLCQYLFKVIYKNFSGHKNLLEHSVQGILKAQQMSILQQNQKLPLNKVLDITLTKGGNAVLFYRSSINHPLSEEENELLKNLGGLFQMTNDINDALRDHHAGESTFMTIGLTLREISEIFDNQINQTIEACKSLPKDQYQKKNLFNRINILLARSLLTLDRYEHITDPEKPFYIRDIPKNKVVSGLKIPYELRRWYRHYKRLSIPNQ